MIQLLEELIIDPELGFHYAYTQQITSEAHWHDFYEFFITFDDEVIHIVNGSRQRLPEGSIVLIRPRDYHCFECMPSNNCSLLNIAFTESTFQALMTYLNNDALLQWLDNNKLPLTLQLRPYEQKTIKAGFDKLALSANPDRSHLFLDFKALLTEVFVHCFIKGMQTESSSAPQWLKDLQEKMQRKENLAAKLAGCIELSGKSQEYLNRSIKKHYGLTTTEWLNGFKVQHAAGLLQYTNEGITDVAFESGFENLSHFYHVFKRVFSISPAKFRKLYQKHIVPNK